MFKLTKNFYYEKNTTNLWICFANNDIGSIHYFFSENFDSYTAGNTIVAENGSLWATWSGGAGNIEDAFVEDIYSNTPSNSLNVYNGGAGNYVHDVVAPFPSV